MRFLKHPQNVKTYNFVTYLSKISPSTPYSSFLCKVSHLWTLCSHESVRHQKALWRLLKTYFCGWSEIFFNYEEANQNIVCIEIGMSRLLSHECLLMLKVDQLDARHVFLETMSVKRKAPAASRYFFWWSLTISLFGMI